MLDDKLSYNEWQLAGRYVRKGETNVGFILGVAQFNRSQTEPTPKHVQKTAQRRHCSSKQANNLLTGPVRCKCCGKA